MLTPLLLAALLPASAAEIPGKKLLPKALKKVRIGAPMADVKALRPALHDERTEDSFRYIYTEQLPAGSGPEAVVYYFDVDLPGNPLYEVILIYPDKGARDAAADKLFGPPNAGDEWSLDVKGEPWSARAWTFETKLIVAARMKGTEWEEGWGQPAEAL